MASAVLRHKWVDCSHFVSTLYGKLLPLICGPRCVWTRSLSCRDKAILADEWSCCVFMCFFPSDIHLHIHSNTCLLLFFSGPARGGGGGGHYYTLHARCLLQLYFIEELGCRSSSLTHTSTEIQSTYRLFHCHATPSLNSPAFTAPLLPLFFSYSYIFLTPLLHSESCFDMWLQ